MQSGQQAGQPAQPGQQPGQPAGEGEPEGEGELAQYAAGTPTTGSDVPPELAKLGVSAKDWEKLKDVLRSDVAGGGGSGIPEEYRGLVKRYFQEVAKGER
jgi:hypothetical protein